jgi:hypothetical protein
MTYNDQQRRTEFIRNTKGALNQGTTLEQRTAAREAKADQWAAWFHSQIDRRGGSPIDHLPDALAELEERITDQLAGALRELKNALQRALK